MAEDMVTLSIYDKDGLLIAAIVKSKSVGILNLANNGYGELKRSTINSYCLEVTESFCIPGIGSKIWVRPGYKILEIEK